MYMCMYMYVHVRYTPMHVSLTTTAVECKRSAQTKLFSLQIDHFVRTAMKADYASFVAYTSSRTTALEALNSRPTTTPVPRQPALFVLVLFSTWRFNCLSRTSVGASRVQVWHRLLYRAAILAVVLLLGGGGNIGIILLHPRRGFATATLAE